MNQLVATLLASSLVLSAQAEEVPIWLGVTDKYDLNTTTFRVNTVSNVTTISGVVRSIEDQRPDFLLIKIEATTCREGFGGIQVNDLNGEHSARQDYVSGSGTHISAIGDVLCMAYGNLLLSVTEKKNAKSFRSPPPNTPLVPFVSQPSDRFTLGVPPSWTKHVMAKDGGRSYVFQAPETTLALSIEVRAPNSLGPLLEKIQETPLTSDQLTDLQRRFQQMVPEKTRLLLSLTEISNQKSLTQRYVLKHVSAGRTGFLSGREHQFLYRGKQYVIGYSVGAWSMEDSERLLDDVERRIVQPILFTFFVN